METRISKRRRKRKAPLLLAISFILLAVLYNAKFGQRIGGFRAESILLDAPVISQLPELPRGCEVTSLAMLLQYQGVSIDKMKLAEEVQKVPFSKDGFNGNPHDGFVGSMTSLGEPGLGVYSEPIYKLADQYLPGKLKI